MTIEANTNILKFELPTPYVITGWLIKQNQLYLFGLY